MTGMGQGLSAGKKYYALSLNKCGGVRSKVP